MEHHDIWVFGVVAPDHERDRLNLFYTIADQIELVTGKFSLFLPRGSNTGWLVLRDKSNAQMAVQYLETRDVRSTGEGFASSYGSRKSRDSEPSMMQSRPKNAIE